MAPSAHASDGELTFGEPRARANGICCLGRVSLPTFSVSVLFFFNDFAAGFAQNQPLASQNTLSWKQILVGCASWTLSGEQHSDPPNVLHDAQDVLESLILSSPNAY
jgi:hypothetical protein